MEILRKISVFTADSSHGWIGPPRTRSATNARPSARGAAALGSTSVPVACRKRANSTAASKRACTWTARELVCSP